jgi:hypothetical protein
MRTVSLAVAGVLLVVTGRVLAQPAVDAALIPPGELVSSPIPVPATEAASLPGGTDVSRPLQPVIVTTPQPEAAPASATKDLAELVEADCACRGVGRSWGSNELLIWWPKAHPLPPLVTASRGGPPVYGRPGTTLLIGGRAIDNQDIAGGRFVTGWSLSPQDYFGIEAAYFFLGTRTLSESVTDITNPRFRSVGLPFVNALTGEEDVLALARPGLSSTLVTVSTTTRVQGAEVNGVGHLFGSKHLALRGIVGYRFLQVHEGLRVEERWLEHPTPESGGLKTFGMIADQFDAHNRFHGGQLGLSADLRRGVFFTELVGKVALGRTFEVVKVDGATHLITAANPVPLLRSFPGGVYAQPTNMGRTTRGAFAVVPEATLKLGLRGDHSRLYVGYNFLYLSDAVRPGDQIDRTLNPTQIPLLNPGGPVTGVDRPRAAVVRGDFWVQGLVVGWESRY